jgi:tRNA(Ile)-lysidine synthase
LGVGRSYFVPKQRIDLVDPQILLRDFPSDRPCLIGVSGGRDSVALLHQLVELGYANLTLCHLNHRLRGRYSQADAKFVNRLAIQLGCDLVLRTVDVGALAATKKMSIEAAGRDARYQFFAAVAKRHRCHTVFVGHHADDLVETFLLNLFRGAGPGGLRGMRETTTRRIGRIDLQIVRPMLATWREQIDDYVRRHRLKFREDSSNAELDALRNRVRHRAIPYLEKLFGRRIRQNLWRTAMIAAEEENFWEMLVPQTGRELMVAPLRNTSVALQRRLLHKWLRSANVADVGFDLVERVRALLETTARVSKTNLPKDRHVRRRGGKLFVE